MRLTRGNLSSAQQIMVPTCFGFSLALFTRCILGPHRVAIGVDALLPFGAYAAGFGGAAVLMLLGMVTQNPDRYQLGANLLAVTAGVWALSLIVAVDSWEEVWGFYWAWPVFVALGAYSVHRSLETSRKPL